MRHGQSRKVHFVSNGNVLFALSEVVERKGHSQGFDRLHLVLDPCNDKRFNSAGCKRNIIIQGSKIWYVITAFSPSCSHSCLGFILTSWLGMVFPFSSHGPTPPLVWAYCKVVRRVCKGRLSIQKEGMKSGLGMHGSKGSH